MGASGIQGINELYSKVERPAWATRDSCRTNKPKRSQTHWCEPRIHKAEAGGLSVLGQPGLKVKKPCFRKKKKAMSKKARVSAGGGAAKEVGGTLLFLFTTGPL